jgi:hypothetical protein
MSVMVARRPPQGSEGPHGAGPCPFQEDSAPPPKRLLSAADGGPSAFLARLGVGEPMTGPPRGCLPGRRACPLILAGPFRHDVPAAERFDGIVPDRGAG